VGKQTLSRRAISVLLKPSEASRIILARSASRWLDLGRLAINLSFSFSAELRTIVATGLPISITLCKLRDAILLCISLSGLAGWTTVHGPAGRQACLEYIGEQWADMRPRSLIESMERNAKERASEEPKPAG
jgi:MbtH-like protein